MFIEVLNHPGGVNKRLDLFLSKCGIISFSRTSLQKLIKEGAIKVNGKTAKSNYILGKEDKIDLELPELKSIDTNPEPIPLDIIFEDQFMIALNKPAGLIVHPTAHIRSGTMVNALLYHCKNLSGINGYERPGIVHRLDKETSGLIIIAKDDITHRGLSLQFSSRNISKIYIAIACGLLKKNIMTIDLPIGRDLNDRKKISNRTIKPKESMTELKVLERYQNCSLIELYPKTGRTHQIRVHLEHIGFPIIGDKVYGKGILKNSKITANRHMLHARSLSFTHPHTGEPMHLEAPLPEDMTKLIESLRNDVEFGEKGKTF